MKKRILSAVLVITLAACAAGLIACSNKNVYDKLAEEGYDVKVTFDAGGAVVNETQNVTIVEVFNSDDRVTVNGKTGIQLLAPDDARRGEGVFKIAKSDGQSNYFCPGWYRERTPRTDGEGNPLDAYGVPTAQSGREQSYVYSGRWDFDTDVVDPETLENGEMTLYAAWIPFFTYEIYAEDGEGGFELIKTFSRVDINMPEWNERTGKISMKDMPKRDGYTFREAYLDENMTQVIENAVDGDGLYADLDSGIAETTVIKIYTAWLEGSWLKIFDAEQLAEELCYDPNGNYILGADLDFTDVEWPRDLYGVTFNGSIVADGHVFVGLTLASGEAATSPEQLFEAMGENAFFDGGIFDAE